MSQHASVCHSSWRPDLTNVSTTTTARKGITYVLLGCTVSTHTHTQHNELNSEAKRSNTTRSSAALCAVVHQIHRRNVTSCQQNGARRPFLSDLYKSEREPGSRCRVCEEVRGAGLLPWLLSESAARHVCTNKTCYLV